MASTVVTDTQGQHGQLGGKKKKKLGGGDNTYDQGPGSPDQHRGDGNLTTNTYGRGKADNTVVTDALAGRHQLET